MPKTLIIKLLAAKTAKDFLRRIHAYLPAGLFLLGILYDVVTLDRIDHWPNILQQGIFLFLIALFLTGEMLERWGHLPLPKKLQPYWPYHEFLSHFFFGSLLSAFTLFYFKSTSLLYSFTFFSLLTVFLIANEVPRFQRLGIPLRACLLSLCLTSYFVYVVPILTKSIGPFAFLAAVSLSLALTLFLFRWLWIKLQQTHWLSTQLLFPSLGVQLLFGALYLFGSIPPVPLSLEYLGVYHDVEKVGEEYRLSSTRPRWKFWQNGDQTFLLRESDSIYCFTRVFSPTDFRHKIVVRWMHKDVKRGWQTWDQIPIDIVGGRKEGFRGYTYKRNFVPGKWRIQIETSDERELGRIYLRVIPDPSSEEREFTIERS